MASIDLIDTTEMYLKTIYELEEDGITPLRARIVDRLGHSGPTVSQTVARMERDGLVTVLQDRRLDLTEQGRERAAAVMRKHRLAERLLVDVIGMDWTEAHEEACRWEHVMSRGVEDQLSRLLEDPEFDPYGNPIPGYEGERVEEVSLEDVLLDDAARETSVPITVTLRRIGEPVQAWEGMLADLHAANIRPRTVIEVTSRGAWVEILAAEEAGETASVRLPRSLAGHLFAKKQ